MDTKKIFLSFILGYGCLMAQDTTSDIGLSQENRTAISSLLNKILADEFTLFSRTLNHHWNVVGPSFAEYHEFFRDEYKKLLDYTDDIAERIKALGGAAQGLPREIMDNTRFEPIEREGLTNLEIMQKQYSDHSMFIRNLRRDLEIARDLGDEGTSNFLTDLMEKHEKLAWMIKSFNEKKSR